jgi:ankyrin repeat protein
VFPRGAGCIRPLGAALSTLSRHCLPRVPTVSIPMVCTRGSPAALLRACEGGDAARVAALLRAGCNPNRQMPSELGGALLVPIVASVMHGHASCTRLLLDARARPDAPCGVDMETALHVCCASGNEQLLKLCLGAGAEPAAADRLGRSPLLMCCLNDQPGCAALMLEARADAEQSMTTHNPGATALYAAALVGSSRCVALLCEVGVRARRSNAGRLAALHLGTSVRRNEHPAFDPCFRRPALMPRRTMLRRP